MAAHLHDGGVRAQADEASFEPAAGAPQLTGEMAAATCAKQWEIWAMHVAEVLSGLDYEVSQLRCEVQCLDKLVKCQNAQIIATPDKHKEAEPPSFMDGSKLNGVCADDIHPKAASEDIDAVSKCASAEGMSSPGAVSELQGLVLEKSSSIAAHTLTPHLPTKGASVKDLLDDIPTPMTRARFSLKELENADESCTAFSLAVRKRTIPENADRRSTADRSAPFSESPASAICANEGDELSAALPSLATYGPPFGAGVGHHAPRERASVCAAQEPVADSSDQLYSRIAECTVRASAQSLGLKLSPSNVPSQPLSWSPKASPNHLHRRELFRPSLTLELGRGGAGESISSIPSTARDNSVNSPLPLEGSVEIVSETAAPVFTGASSPQLTQDMIADGLAAVRDVRQELRNMRPVRGSAICGAQQLLACTTRRTPLQGSGKWKRAPLQDATTI